MELDIVGLLETDLHVSHKSVPMALCILTEGFVANCLRTSRFVRTQRFDLIFTLKVYFLVRSRLIVEEMNYVSTIFLLILDPQLISFLRI